MLIIALVFAAMLLSGRYIRSKAEAARAEAAAEAAAMTHYRIRIVTPGGAKPKRKDVTERYAVETTLTELGIAQVTDTSIGDTYVEIVAAVREPGEGLRAIESVLAESGLSERATVERQDRRTGLSAED